MSASAERVVITGVGAISPIGRSAAEFWSGLLAGRSGFGRVTSFDVTGQRTEIGCEVAGFDERPWRERCGGHGGRAAALAAAAAAEALGQAGLVGTDDGRVFGVCVGTTMGEVRVLEEHLERPGTVDLADYPCATIAAHLAEAFGLRGPNLMIPNACAAGNFALGAARDLLLCGEADAVLAGGVDPYSRVAHTGFNRLFAVSPDICRPFHRHRRGIIPGEGAGMLVLERESAARARRAPILAVLLGCGFTNDAGHITNPDPEGAGLVRAIGAALREAGLVPADVDYLSAHGTGTPANDLAESRAIHAVFGERAGALPVSSIKSMIGHTMGAASALEAVACVLALRDGLIPPTMHCDDPDPACGLDVVPDAPRRAELRVVLSNAMAFGGTNAAVILGRGEA